MSLTIDPVQQDLNSLTNLYGFRAWRPRPRRLQRKRASTLFRKFRETSEGRRHRAPLFQSGNSSYSHAYLPNHVWAAAAAALNAAKEQLSANTSGDPTSQEVALALAEAYGSAVRIYVANGAHPHQIQALDRVFTRARDTKPDT